MSQIEINTKEYAELCQSRDKLAALEAAGVNNWEGYDIAMEALGTEEEEETVEENLRFSTRLGG